MRRIVYLNSMNNVWAEIFVLNKLCSPGVLWKKKCKCYKCIVLLITSLFTKESPANQCWRYIYVCTQRTRPFSCRCTEVVRTYVWPVKIELTYSLWTCKRNNWLFIYYSAKRSTASSTHGFGQNRDVQIIVLVGEIGIEVTAKWWPTYNLEK